MNIVRKDRINQVGFWRRVLAALVAGSLLVAISGGLVSTSSLFFWAVGDHLTLAKLWGWSLWGLIAISTLDFIVLLSGARKSRGSSRARLATISIIPSIVVGNSAVFLVNGLLGWPASLTLSIVLAIAATILSLTASPSGLVLSAFGYGYAPSSSGRTVRRIMFRRVAAIASTFVFFYVAPLVLLSVGARDAKDYAAIGASLFLWLYWAVLGPVLTAFAFTLMLIPVGNGRRVIDALTGAVAVKSPSLGAPVEVMAGVIR